MAADANSNKVLNLPWEILDAGPGIAIDIGGSVIKVLFIHKDEYPQPGQRTGPTGQVRLANFAREDIDEAFDYMKKHVYIRRSHPDETVSIYTTGIGGSTFSKRIRSELNVKTQNIPESDCFLHSFNYLMRNISRTTVLMDIDTQLFEKSRKRTEAFAETVKKLATLSDTLGKHTEKKDADTRYPQESYVTIDKPLHEQEDIYPCLVLALGSGMGGIKVGRDGKVENNVMLPMGGRMFLGIGSLLTGSKSFGELMDLCEKGEAKNVGLTNIEICQDIDREDDDSIYAAFADMDEMMTFFFAKAVNKTIADFRKEDLGRAWLEYVVHDIANMVHLACRHHGISNIILCGGFASHPLSRQLLTKAWLDVDGPFAQFERTAAIAKIGIHFLRHGSHLGSLGSYLNSTLQFTGKFGASNVEKKESTAIGGK